MIKIFPSQILIFKEVSSMSSSWAKHVCDSRVGNKWSLGSYSCSMTKPIDQFRVPLEVIDEAVQRVKDGTIAEVVYDVSTTKFVHSS
jgi:hypothetical protein